MADSEKETSSAIDSKKKSSVLDEEIGGDFLSSWKSKTVDKDPFDFNCEALPKGRKNDFNFSKMDMDFALGGDFDKISSFKMDMSDLDFSSPPRKAEKAKENSRKESLLGKKEGKQDPFTFSFDFNELDGFDLGSSFQKTGKKSEKPPARKEVDSKIEAVKNQQSTSHSSTSLDTFGIVGIGGTKKLQAVDSGTTAMLDNLVCGHADISSNNGASLPENSGSQDAPPVTTNSPEKEPTAFTQQIGGECNEAQHHREQSHTASFMEPCAHHAIQATSTQSISGDDTVHGTVPKLQTRFLPLNAEAYTNNCSGPANSTKSVSSSRSQNSSPVKSYSSKVSTPTGKAKPQKSDNAFEKDSESQEYVSRENATGKESTHDETVIEDAPIVIMSKKQPGSRAIGGKSILNVLMPPLHRDELRNNEGQATIQKFNILKSLNGPVTKGLSVTVETEKIVKDCDISCSQVHQTSLAARLVTSGAPKVVPKLAFSSIASVGNSKTSCGKKLFEIANSKVPRNTASNSEPWKYIGQQEKNLEKLSESSTGNSDKLTLLSPSLKRKSFEPHASLLLLQGSNADPSTLNPLKRATESPTESRNALENPQRTVDKRATLTPDCPLEKSTTDLEVQLLMESDGNVEKAEACAKELDDICNMLKKKHDEAKELLVRAIVNNNQLLMLNHPIFEEKIRKIQMCSKSLLSQERQF